MATPDPPARHDYASHVRAAVVVAAVILGLVGAIAVDLERTWGWDESMHAELPAARIALSARSGDLAGVSSAVLECQQYPFALPLLLGGVQALTGISEAAARRTGRVLWAMAWFGIWLVFEELARLGLAHARRAGTFALLAALASPLAWAYSGTLFLEGAFVCAAVYALRAWLARKGELDERTRMRHDFAAGTWIAIAFFTKFNYGLLLALGFALDFALEAFAELRARRARALGRRAACVAAVPLAAALWWFVLPLPGGTVMAAAHRAAFAGFLGGNLGGASVAWSLRTLDWIFALGPSLGVALFVAVGALAGLAPRWRSGVATLALVLLALAVPIALHPFHLDRFLLPVLVPLWCLAGVGLSRLWQHKVAFFPLLLLPLFPGDLAQRPLLRALGLWNEEHAAYLTRELLEKQNLLPNRKLPTAGLRRSEADALLDLAAGAAGPDARFGWLGVSSELSPAAIHLGLLARGGSRERFLADAHLPLDVTFEGADPQWTEARLAQFAGRFALIFATDPPDLVDRPSRRFEARYRELLTGPLGWSQQTLGSVEIQKGARPPYPVRLTACRPPER